MGILYNEGNLKFHLLKVCDITALILIKQQLYKPSMNFTLTSPSDPQYNKLMMQKHMEQSKRWRDVSSQLYSPTNIRNNYSQIILNNKTSPPLVPQRKKTLNDENEKMKKYYRDQIEESLMESKNRKQKQWMEERQMKKSMATQNGVMDYLERQIEKRNTFIQGCWKKQQKMHNYYIDEDRIKHQRAMRHINHNYDSDVFNHTSDYYQAMQKINESQVNETNSVLKQLQRSEREYQRSNYGVYLNGKCEKEKHNPITNPIEYHIENPYLKSRISRY